MKYWYIFFVFFIIISEGKTNVIIGNPVNFRDLLTQLQPDDTLYLVPGNYYQSLRVISLLGTINAPIVISGQPGMAKPVFWGNSCCNTISLTQSSFLKLIDIICDGQNIVGIDAIKAEGTAGNWTHDIEIDGLEIYHYGGDQQNVGISTKCPSWNWWVHHSIIDAAGTGFYFGNSDGNQPFAAGLIEYNLFLNTLGYNGQIKHQNIGSRNLSLGMPGESATIIRYNVFSKALNASSGNLARPNLLVGNFPASGPGANDFYNIYGNFFFQNPVEGLFQGTGNIGFHNNILFNSVGGWGISVQNHNGFSPRDIDIFFNTIVVSGNSGISITGVNNNYVQRVWANAVFSQNPISGGQQSQNISDSFVQAGSYLANPSLPLSAMELIPNGTSLNVAGINLSFFNKYLDSGFDFDGRLRSGRTAGAYTADSFVWPLQLNIRNIVDIQDVSTSTEIFVDQNSINIYPNPSNQFVQIEGLLSDYNLSILDVNGTIYRTLQTTSNILSVDIEALPSGIFFISIFNKSNNNLSMVKMIKQ